VGNTGGSGTVIYSKPGPDGDLSTYVLTNEHVIDPAIKVDTRWSTLLKRDVKVDILGVVDIHFFEYRWKSRAVGQRAIQADIMTYSKEEDLALLKLRYTGEVPALAKLYPRHEEHRLMATMPVFCVGAGMGEPPVITEGMLSQFGREMDNKEFWLNTAPAIYGNSGGALFLAESHELIGVPSRMAVAALGFTPEPVTHLQYAIPITRIYEFLERERFRFIYDPAFSEAGEAEDREHMRRETELALAARERGRV
jgi:S1-C subfamily serine protease